MTRESHRIMCFLLFICKPKTEHNRSKNKLFLLPVNNLIYMFLFVVQFFAFFFFSSLFFLFFFPDFSFEEEVEASPVLQSDTFLFCLIKSSEKYTAVFQQ